MSTTAPPTAHPIEEYAQALAREGALELSDQRTIRRPHLFIVDCYVPAEESEDGRAFYWGSSDGGAGNVAFYADDVTLDMTREQVENRKPPSAAQIVRELRLLDSFDFTGFETDETDVAGMEPGSIQVYGSTDDGLRFGFVVTVSDVQIADI